MKQVNHRLLLLGILLLLFGGIISAQHQETPKGIFIPSKQAQEDDYNNPESRFNYKYKAESENIVVMNELDLILLPGQNINHGASFSEHEAPIPSQKPKQRQVQWLSR